MPDLPPVVVAYFNATPDADTKALSAIFAADARVHDEARDYTGLDEIRAWRVATYARTPFIERPLSAQSRDDAVVVSVEVSGAFPNSPVVLDQSFTLFAGRIASLDIR